jgi:cytochrome P450
MRYVWTVTSDKPDFSSDGHTALLQTLFLPFFIPIKIVLERVARAFRQSSVVQIKGQPIRVFCINDPEHVAQLFSDRQAGGTKLPQLLPRVRAVMGGGGFISAGGEAYRKRRQQVQPAFKRSEVGDLVRDIPASVDAALDAWPEPAPGSSIDIYKPVRLLMMRANMRMLLSVDLSDEEVAELDEETHFLEQHFVRLSPLVVPLPSNIRFRRLARRLRSRMRRIVQQHRLNPKDHGVLSHLTGLHHEDGKPWSDDDVVDEILSIHFGASVMSTTLTMALFRLGENPRVQEKLAAEIQASPGQASALESLAGMTYGQAVLKEVIRFYPAVWGYPRWTDHELDFSGVRIPAKSLVIPMVSLVHVDPRFWREPPLFRPERFEEEDAPAQHSFTYLPFSAGPRTCLGTHLAPVVMQLVMNRIVSRYRIVACSRFIGDPELDLGFGIQPRDEVRVHLEQRRECAQAPEVLGMGSTQNR